MPASFALACLSAAHFACHYFLLIFPTAALAIEDDWRLGYGEALSLGAPMYVCFAIATPFAGWLGDRLSGDRLIAVQFLGLGLGGIGAGLARDAVELQVALAAVGVFAAIYHPVGLAMVTRLSARRGRALAVNGVWGNLGLAAATAATALLAQSHGWRAAFLAPGAAAALVGLVGLVASRAPQTAETAERASETVAVAAPTQRRVLALVLAAALLGGLGFNGVSITLPKLFDERLGAWTQDLAGVGGFAALVFAVAAFAQLPVGAALDRFGGRKTLLWICGLEAAAMAWLAASAGGAALPAALVTVTLMFAGIPISGWLLGRYVAASWRSRAFAAEYLLSLGATAVVAPGMAALHSAGVGFDRQYLVFAVGSGVVAALALLLLREHRSRAATA